MVPDGTTTAEIEKKELQHTNSSENPARAFFEEHFNSPKSPFRSVFQVLFFLLPTWLQSYILPSKDRKPRQIRKTSFLDGLRGVAALLVVILHHMGPKKYWYSKPFSLGPYDEGEDPQDYTSPLQLPIIRLLYSPEGMVPMFFYISGYVLSFRAVQIIHGKKKGELSEILFSSIFRRGFRLFIPSIAGIALMEAGAAFGMHQFGHPAPGLWGYVLDFLTYVDNFFQALWGWDVADDKLMQFWTIPVEFVCSMILFIVLLGTSGLHWPVRMFCVVCIQHYVMQYGHHWGISCFLGGLLIAEIEELFDSNKPKETIRNPGEDVELTAASGERLDKSTLGSSDWTATPTRLTRYFLHNVFWLSVLLFSLIVLGWPVKNIEKDPFLYWARRDYPWIEWNLWAAFLYINCLFRFPWLQKIYTTRIALYLGDISYSMYIVHYYLILYYGETFEKHANSIFGVERKGHINRAFGNAFEMIPMLFIVIWQADVFWRVIDIPSVKFARWVETMCKKPRS